MRAAGIPAGRPEQPSHPRRPGVSPGFTRTRSISPRVTSSASLRKPSHVEWPVSNAWRDVSANETICSARLNSRPGRGQLPRHGRPSCSPRVRRLHGCDRERLGQTCAARNFPLRSAGGVGVLACGRDHRLRTGPVATRPWGVERGARRPRSFRGTKKGLVLTHE
jgi:hypothetical protein